MGEMEARQDGLLYHNPERCRSWLNWHDWKSCVLFRSTVGSNPTLSASFLDQRLMQNREIMSDLTR